MGRNLVQHIVRYLNLNVSLHQILKS